MATSQEDLAVSPSKTGAQIIQLSIDIAAGADPTQAHTFERAFGSAPKILGCVRVDTNAAENFFAKVHALSATALTLAIKGTTTVDHTYKVTLLGEF